MPPPPPAVTPQVVQVVQAVNPGIRILRARFSSLVARDLTAALAALGPPNAAAAAAVDARQELDLRVGASFTRLQTLLLQVGTGKGGGRVFSQPGWTGKPCAANMSVDNCPWPGTPPPSPTHSRHPQSKYDWSSVAAHLPQGAERDPTLSYGPCQFPTLGLIVQRAWWVEGWGAGGVGDDGQCGCHARFT